MRSPIVVRSRSYQDWLDDCAENEKKHREQRVKDLEKIIGQNTLVQETQRRHIKSLEDENGLLHVERDREVMALVQLRRQNEELRKEYAGDLQLAHTRYDEFVRDMLEKILTRAAPAPAAAARSSNPQEEKLPDVVQSAIDEFSFGNPIIAEQLTAEAWRRVKRNEKAEEIAEKILAGETPD